MPDSIRHPPARDVITVDSLDLQAFHARHAAMMVKVQIYGDATDNRSVAHHSWPLTRASQPSDTDFVQQISRPPWMPDQVRHDKTFCRADA